jgi:hypothetical protein
MFKLLTCNQNQLTVSNVSSSTTHSQSRENAHAI